MLVHVVDVSACVLKICSKFTGDHPCRSEVQSNLIETALRHGCFPANLLHIFRTPFRKKTSGRLLNILLSVTAWKVSKYWVLPNPYFPVFELNKGKYGPEKIPYMDTFHTVSGYCRSSRSGDKVIYLSCDLELVKSLLPAR